MYIIIERFDKDYPVIVTDTLSNPMMFDTEEEALAECDNCQDGQVVELT